MKLTKDSDSLFFFTQKMAILCKIMPVHRALRTVVLHEEDLQLKKVELQLLAGIMKGKLYSHALSRYPEVFPPFYVGLVKIGETTGELALMLERLSSYLETNNRIQKGTKSVLVYPVFIFGISLILLYGFFNYILPRLLNVISSSVEQLPLPTKILIFASNWIFNPIVYGILFGVIILGQIFLKRIYSTENGRFMLDKLQITLPFAGKIIKQNLSAVFLKSLGYCIEAGVPITTTMKVCAESLGNSYFTSIVGEPVCEDIKQGASFSGAITNTRYFPLMVSNMILAGEESGELAAILHKSSELIYQDFLCTISSFQKAFEPVTMFFVGGIVGFVMIAIFMPLAQIIGGL